MQLHITFSTFFLLITTLEWLSADESCSEANLRECLGSFQQFLEDEYTFAKKTETEFNEYCLALQKNSNCVRESTEACKKDYKLIAALTTALYNHLNQLCIPSDARLTSKLNSMVPCFDNHTNDFHECSGMHLNESYEDPQLHAVCLDLKSMLCVSEKSRELCGEDGESFAKILEYHVKDEYDEVCSGSTALFNNYTILLLSFFVSFLSSLIRY
ncbi:uncharacterized protein CDAR_456111 [Caerostris darwini]|uniref:DUF19 domain-containing protein n=1 Tax=Caerostris darwini TaxID=1538125 RepID=A0AAV4RQP9_9ARAC|nr:uncharacterized protein CDAR_456111 [Caerostris darwini]